jgi:hypothetical protein
MVAVIETSGDQVVFRRVSDGRAFALAVADGRPRAFFVGSGGRVWRYALEE